MNRADYQSLRDFLGSVRHARLEQERLTERVLELEAQCTRLTAQMRQTPGRRSDRRANAVGQSGG